MRKLLSALLVLGACEQKPQIACGPGTQEQNGVCVANPSSGSLFEGIEGKLTTSKTSLSWEPASTPREDALYDIIATKNGLFAAGDHGTILHSTDRGNHWKVIPGGTTKPLYDIQKNKNDSTVYVCGAKGTVLRTKDDFLQAKDEDKWEDLSSVDTKDLYGLFISGDELIVVGQAGTLLRYQENKTNPAESTWKSGLIPTEKDLYTITKFKQNFWAAGQEGTLLRSKDGLNWEKEELSTQQDLIYLRNTVDALYVVARDGATFQYSEKKWSQIAEPVPGVELSDLWGEDDTWFAVGKSGVILQSNGLGKPWRKTTSGVDTDLKGAYGNNKMLFATGDAGTVLLLEPWNIWISNKSDVDLRVRFGNRAALIHSKQSEQISAPPGESMIAYLDEDANVFEQRFTIEPEKTYKLTCNKGETTKLECDDLSGFQEGSLELPDN